MAPSGVCPFVLTRKLVFHSLLSLLLIGTHTLQAVLLDIFLISEHPNSLNAYFWIIADFIIVLMFGITMLRSYSHWKKSTGNKIRVKTKTQIAEDRRRPSFYTRNRLHLGFHPLCYLTWFCYSTVLVCKIILIFKSDIVNLEPEDSYLGPQLIKLAIALTAIVFFLFVEGHYDAARSSKQAVYIASLVKGTAFEIFDTISFISMLFVEETKMVYSFEFQNVIIAFAAISLLIPNVCFFKLSHTDYGRVTTSSIFSFIYKMLHLILVNIPYMFIRIYLWFTMGTPVSIFLIKNLLNIVLALLDSRDDFFVTRRSALKWNEKRKSSVNAAQTVFDSSANSNSFQMDPSNQECKIDMGEVNFVDIDLKHNSHLHNYQNDNNVYQDNASTRQDNASTHQDGANTQQDNASTHEDNVSTHKDDASTHQDKIPKDDVNVHPEHNSNNQQKPV